jgi:hypothetical protein
LRRWATSWGTSPQTTFWTAYSANFASASDRRGASQAFHNRFSLPPEAPWATVGKNLTPLSRRLRRY